MDMKRTVFFFTLSLAVMLVHAQLTLEECQRRAQDNYPLVRQYGLCLLYTSDAADEL